MTNTEKGELVFCAIALALFSWALWIMDPTPAIVGLGLVMIALK